MSNGEKERTEKEKRRKKQPDATWDKTALDCITLLIVLALA